MFCYNEVIRIRIQMENVISWMIAYHLYQYRNLGNFRVYFKYRKTLNLLKCDYLRKQFEFVGYDIPLTETQRRPSNMP